MRKVTRQTLLFFVVVVVVVALATACSTVKPRNLFLVSRRKKIINIQMLHIARYCQILHPDYAQMPLGNSSIFDKHPHAHVWRSHCSSAIQGVRDAAAASFTFFPQVEKRISSSSVIITATNGNFD